MSKRTVGRPAGEPDPDVTAFIRAYWDLANAEFSELEMVKPTKPRPWGSKWVRFGPCLQTAGLAAKIRFRHKMTSDEGPDRVDIEIDGWAGRLAGATKATAHLRPPEIGVKDAGKSLAFSVNVPSIDVHQPFAPQEAVVRESLAAAARLQRWWNANLPELVKLTADLPDR